MRFGIAYGSATDKFVTVTDLTCYTPRRSGDTPDVGDVIAYWFVQDYRPVTRRVIDGMRGDKKWFLLEDNTPILFTCLGWRDIHGNPVDFSVVRKYETAPRYRWGTGSIWQSYRAMTF